jgi:hypothetical protein
MPFIGTQPRAGAYDLLDSITVSATDTFNLLLNGSAYYPQSPNHLLVSLNGTIQAPVNSFTISGSQIVFSENLLVTDVIDFILALGDVLSIGTPSANAVITSSMQDGAVTTTKLASSLDLSAKTMTYGNLPSANLTGALPAIDGSSLTGLTESQITDLQSYLTSTTGVTKTASTGSGELPSGTTAQRDGSPSAGYIRFNTTTVGFEGYDGSAWGAIGGGASAGGAIYENNNTITSSYTIAAGKNGHSVGPITISSGAAVTITSGQRWVVA